MPRRRAAYAAVAFLMLIASISPAQLSRVFQQDEPAIPNPPKSPENEFSFARLVYRTEGRRFGWPFGWDTDYPKADRQFMMAVKRLSRVDAHDKPVTLEWGDPRMYQYPFLYAVEVGFMILDPKEATKLREYLDRGGFLMVDDFHGDFEWAHFEQEMRKVYPDRPIEDIDINDPIFHCVFDINEKMQIPVVSYAWRGVTHEKGGVTPRYRAIRDDKGRVVIMIVHNCDIGDAWEWADLPEYPEKFSTMAFRVGINSIVYSMTH